MCIGDIRKEKLFRVCVYRISQEPNNNNNEYIEKTEMAINSSNQRQQ